MWQHQGDTADMIPLNKVRCCSKLYTTYSKLHKRVSTSCHYRRLIVNGQGLLVVSRTSERILMELGIAVYTMVQFVIGNKNVRVSIYNSSCPISYGEPNGQYPII